MKTKQLTSLLALTFLFLFSGSVYGEETEVKKEFYDSGKLLKETQYKNGKKEGLETTWSETGEKFSGKHYKDGELDGLHTFWTNVITTSVVTEDRIRFLNIMVYGLLVWWGLLYIGFWISSGLKGDKKKDETNE